MATRDSGHADLALVDDRYAWPKAACEAVLERRLEHDRRDSRRSSKMIEED